MELIIKFFTSQYPLFIIGHRGVGKTRLLHHLKKIHTNLNFFDLDEEIEKKTNSDITSLFNKISENAFRELEKETLIELLKNKNPHVISLGAGFEISNFEFPSSSFFLWIRRKTDGEGRIFFNRPSLDKNVSPLSQYLNRFEKRESNYFKTAHLIHEMEEGPFCINSQVNLSSLLFPKTIPNSLLTLLPWHIENETRFIASIIRSPFEYIEVRTDLFSFDKMNNPLNTFIEKIIEEKKLLLSLRSPSDSKWVHSTKYLNQAIDCDISYNNHPLPIDPFILSSHSLYPPDKNNHLKSSTPDINFHNSHYKWSPEIDSYEELKLLINWLQKDPTNRSVFIRSLKKNFSWVRLALKNHQKFHFFRNTPSGSNTDQLTTRQWELNSHSTKGWAAIIGHPVSHSYSPSFHCSFFQNKEMGFLTISLEKEDLSSFFNLADFFKIKALAITSPLKQSICELPLNVTQSPLVKKLKSSNTALIKNKNWLLSNTDYFGCAYFLYHTFIKKISSPPSYEDTLSYLALWGDLNEDQHSLPFTLCKSELKKISHQFVIWGGGGMLPLFQDLLPEACFLSVRTQKERIGSPQINTKSTYLIWAASPQDPEPPLIEKFSVLWDLNYKESSLAREIALKYNLKYYSGESLFFAQGIAQQKLWGYL